MRRAGVIEAAPEDRTTELFAIRREYEPLRVAELNTGLDSIAATQDCVRLCAVVCARLNDFTAMRFLLSPKAF